MRYQLVLQFNEVLVSFDELVSLEDSLSEALKDIAEIDGHDIGTGEANIFVRTDDPAASFLVVRRILERDRAIRSMKAAYRELNGRSYTILWPPDLTKFQVA